ncbi:MAG: signal peptide peptidase SppA [Prevotellaceae bacterium]|jgi:protease-4|nr:signal peptide peptidase SppA [Prevotellaceae bacterium]
MKDFFKYLLATIVGMIIMTFIGLFIFFSMMAGFISSFGTSSEAATVLKPNSVYQLDLSGVLTERSQDDPFSDVFLSEFFGEDAKSIGLDDVLKNIEKAKNNENITGIYLKGGLLSGGYAQIKEIRDALVDFKSSGKFIVAYADMYSQRNYYLASVADKVLLNPSGTLDFKGIASQTTFYKNTLEKLGIEMQIVKVGTFKSAVEPYSETKMSDANRNQVTAYIRSIWNNLLKEVSASRNISVENLNAYADQMMLYQPAEKAVEYNFVDGLAYADEVEDILTSYTDGASVEYVKHGEMNRVTETKKLEKNRIAVIYAVGAIDSGDRDGINSTKLIKTIDEVTQNESVKGVVFRVNSPGGSAYGSEQIWRALMRLKEKKPLVVSMGDYAASGGYYISCMADHIFAEPNTLTGSIGIFGAIPNFDGLNRKIGLTFDGVKTNKMSDAIDLNRAFRPEERDLMQMYVNRGYELFVKRCADGREKTGDEIKAIAEGRVWTGEDALGLGLVDELGGLKKAVEKAAEKANLSDFRIAEYPEKEDFTTKLLKNLSSTIETSVVKAQLGEFYPTYKKMNVARKMNGIYALTPYDITVY